ncbi:MAG: hypothetical protein ACRENE_09340 [Polyangiaceae bacterium]
MKRLSLATAVVVSGLALASTVRAAADDDPALFAAGTKALAEGRANDAVGAFEALADRGMVDPVASYDRALAYAARVRIGPDVPGDLGKAAQGFEESLELTRDPHLADDASRGLLAVRSEIARRRARAGEPVVVDPARSLGRAVGGLLSEDVWALLALAASLAIGAGLFVRRLSGRPRVRVAGGTTAGVATPVLVAAAVMTLAVRSDRLNLHEAVVVTAGARPTDERGLSVPGGTPLPEGARVEVLETRGSVSRVRFGSVEAWVASVTLREIAGRS